MEHTDSLIDVWHIDLNLQL